ncbi:Plastocyanin [endosymbiont of Ridgeia piscesae]|jgi:plastocyanin|uniref:Plastocyanin n=3 Tax=endosymbiont of Ridgeia piscesae TaxID=54398 RepID=A0A0T5YUE6_9GAMM|nr:plastocyanin/azurin family copper-binding protein [endosymbiont of Ridgeia piscesae]KRT53918.1 Plastocyanin [endosymbiont of Ridgeia piscesae]
MIRLKLSCQALLALSLAAIMTTATAGGGAVAQVEIIKFKFLPQVISIKAGQTVRWVNREKRQYHSVWFEQLGDPESDYLFPDDTYERSFGSVGEFPYRCGPHPEMTGIVRVE